MKDSTGEFPGTYALKVLKRDLPIPLRRFHNEIAAINALEHPAIVRIIDHSAIGDLFQFYVMPLDIQAVPLQRYLAGGDDNPYFADALRALSLFERLVEVIAVCERGGVVHRDLSPANVLVKQDGSILVIDFGLCQLDSASAVTLADEGIGTPNYMAPECEAGSTGPITAQADLYSAGKLLWSAVTGQLAFARETPVFTAKSLNVVLTHHPQTWHLHHLFECTVRHKTTDRWPSDALRNRIQRVRQTVERGQLPLELLAYGVCPDCGNGGMERFDRSHNIFGTTIPAGFEARQCIECGACSVVNVAYRKAQLAKRATLS